MSSSMASEALTRHPELQNPGDSSRLGDGGYRGSSMDLPLIPASRRFGAALLVVQSEQEQELRLRPARSFWRELGRGIFLPLWRPTVLSIGNVQEDLTLSPNSK